LKPVLTEGDLRNLLVSAAVGLLLSLGACASSGVNPGAASHFKPGVTTRADAVAALGQPASVYEASDQTKTLTWAASGGLFDSDSTKGLSIQFGPDGRMVRIVSAPKD
jgi:hypothetical protein